MTDTEKLPLSQETPPVQGVEQETVEISPVEAQEAGEAMVDEVVKEAVKEEKEIAEAPSAAPVQQAVATTAKDPVARKIEGVLQDGLTDEYVAMSPPDRLAFKAKGEQITAQIREMMEHGKVKLKSVWELIIEWLQLIPGASRFFIEQEAKIKADRIKRLAEK